MDFNTTSSPPMTSLKQKQKQKGQAISVQCVEGGGVADQSKICHFFFFPPAIIYQGFRVVE